MNTFEVTLRVTTEDGHGVTLHRITEILRQAGVDVQKAALTGEKKIGIVEFLGSPVQEYLDSLRPAWGPARVGPCPCECNRGGFCGGCGHAGCGGRR